MLAFGGQVWSGWFGVVSFFGDQVLVGDFGSGTKSGGCGAKVCRVIVVFVGAGVGVVDVVSSSRGSVVVVDGSDVYVVYVGLVLVDNDLFGRVHGGVVGGDGGYRYEGRNDGRDNDTNELITITILISDLREEA